MHFSQFVVFLPALLAAATAVPAMPDAGLKARAAQDNCNGSINSCFINGCLGKFAHPSDTLGTCTAGTFNGCPCEKCGKKNGSCSDNGCFGVQGVCTAGNFQGCPCK